MENCGLVRRGHSLLYGYRHGALQWAPMWLRGVVVNVWNFIGCSLYGHALVFEGTCCSCCRAVNR